MCNKLNRRVTLLPRLAKEGLVLEQSYVQPICTPTRCTFKCSNVQKNVSDHEGRHWWAGGTQFTPGGSTAFFGQRNLEGCTHLSPSCQGNVQSRSVEYLDPCFPGCSSSKAMQLTWWESGTLVSAAKRCCPPVGWSQFQCSQFQQVKACPQLPRGFDTFYGYYTGSEHYFNHTRWQYHPMKFCSTWDGLLVPQA